MAKLLSLGQVLDKTWHHYTKHFVELLKLSLWMLLPAAVMVIGGLLTPVETNQLIAGQTADFAGAKELIGYIITIVTVVLLYPLTSLWVTGGLIYAVDEQNSGKTNVYLSAAKKTWKNYLSYIWVSILRFIFAGLLPVLLIAPGIALVYLNIAADGNVWLGATSISLTVVGAAAMILTVIWLTILLLFADFSLLLDGKKGMEALKDSKKLVSGRWWRVLWRILIPAILIGAATILLFAILTTATIPLTFPLDAAAQSNVTAIAGNIGSALITAVTLPLLVIVYYFVYDSLTKSKPKT